MLALGRRETVGMGLELLLSSVASGLIATLVMVAVLYAPLLWNGPYFDVLGAIGSFRSGELSGRTRFLGAVIYFAFGLLFALLYGWLALTVMTFPAGTLPELRLLPGFPTEVNAVYPLLGLAVGSGHGVAAALFLTVLLEHHPLPRFQARVPLIASQVASHLVYGLTVMFFQHQFLQLLVR
jgi:hypothetical protein